MYKWHHLVILWFSELTCTLVMNLYNRHKFISSDYKNAWSIFVFAKLLCMQQSNDITMRNKRTVTGLKYRSTFQTISSLLPSVYCDNTLLFSRFLFLRIIYLVLQIRLKKFTISSQIHLSIHLSDSNRVATVCQAPCQTVWRMLYKINERLFQTLSNSRFTEKMSVQLPLVSMEDWFQGHPHFPWISKSANA